MADIESVLTELICDVIDREVDVPDNNEIERMSERITEQYLDDNLSNHVEDEITNNRKVDNIVSSMVTTELESQSEMTKNLFDEGMLSLRREIESHTIAYKFKAIGQWVKAKFKRVIFQKRPNRKKVMIWTLFI